MYLRSIAHYITHDDVQLTVKNLMNPNFYHGRLKNWFTRTWLPHIKRWCLAKKMILFPVDLVTFTEEILNGKLYFLCSVSSK